MELNIENITFFEMSKRCIVKNDTYWNIPLANSVLNIQIKLLQGALADYEQLNDDVIAVYLTDIELRVTQDQFEQLMTPLPQPPSGLEYCSLDDAFVIEDDTFWIYNFELKTFFQSNAFPQILEGMTSCIDITDTYNRDDYGKTWVVLVSR